MPLGNYSAAFIPTSVIRLSVQNASMAEFSIGRTLSVQRFTQWRSASGQLADLACHDPSTANFYSLGFALPPSR